MHVVCSVDQAKAAAEEAASFDALNRFPLGIIDVMTLIHGRMRSHKPHVRMYLGTKVIVILYPRPSPSTLLAYNMHDL